MYKGYGNQPMYTGYQYGQQQNNHQQMLQLRNNQIRALFQIYPSARAIKNDNSVFDVPITFSNNRKVTFRVTLPPQFPQQAPIIQLQARCAKYTYLDQNSNVVCAALSNWKFNSSLATVCKTIFTQFQTYPPKIIQTGGRAMVGMSGNNNQFGQKKYGNNTPSYGPPQSGYTSMTLKEKSHIKIPSIPSNFSEIESLDKDKVESLLKDSIKLEKFIRDLEYVKGIDSLFQSIRDANVKTAQEKIKKDNLLSVKSAKLKSLEKKELELQTTISELNKKRGEIQQKYQPQFIVQKLESLIRKSDNAAEELCDEYMDGNGMKLTQFVKKVVEMKRKTYVRKQKKDQFAHKYLKQQ